MDNRWRRSILAGSIVALAACTANGSAASSGPPSTSSPSVAPAQGRILFARVSASGQGRLLVVDATGSGEQPFSPGRASFETRNLSPDGSRLAIVSANGRGQLVSGTVRVDGSGLRLFASADPTLNLACGVWAPAARMACEAWDDRAPSRDGIYTVRASDGGDPQRLTGARDVPCDYSPDGSQLAFVRSGADGTTGTLMVMDVGRGTTHPVLADVAIAGTSCDWAPDGRSILTGSSDGKLMIVTPTGGSAPFVGDGIDGFASGGRWSLDGSHVLFSMSLTGQQFDVYTAAADGSDLTRITDSKRLEEALSWLP